MELITKRLTILMPLVMAFTACQHTGIPQDAAVTICGTIVDENGQPAENIEVAWVKDEVNNLNLQDIEYRFKSYKEFSEAESANSGTTRTDVSGNFVFNLTGKDVNSHISTDNKPIYAPNYLIILQDDAQTEITDERDGTAIIVSKSHLFSINDGASWNVGTIPLWRNNYVSEAVNQVNNKVDNKNFLISWDEFGEEDYELLVVGAEKQLGWHSRLDKNSVAIPIDTLPLSLMDGLSMTVITKQNDWTYRSYLTELSNLDAVTERERFDDNVLQTNSNWLASGANDTSFLDICSTKGIINFANDSLEIPCDLGNYAQTDGQYILLDFKKMETIDHLILWDFTLHSTADSCLAIYTWDTKDDFYLIYDPWNKKYLLTENCDFPFDQENFTSFDFESTIKTRFLAIAVKGANSDFDETSDQYYFTNLGELGLYRN